MTQEIKLDKAIGVDYSTVDGVDSLFFSCNKLNAKLSVQACTESYKLSRMLESIQVGRRYQCRKCQIGQMHAGETKPTSKIFGRTVCVRCLKPTRRLVCNGICVSCHNRMMEVTKGRNARGTRPVHLKPMWSITTGVLTGSIASVRRFNSVTSTQEVLLSILRKTDGECYFGWPAVSANRPYLSPLLGQTTCTGQ